MPAVAEVLEEAVAWLGERGIDLWQESVDLDEVAGRVHLGQVHVAEIGGRIAGTLQLQWSGPLFWGERPDDAGYVHRLAVRREFAGLGRLLLAWAERQVATTGREYLRLDCARDVEGLRRYYERAGYRHVGDAERGWPASLYEKRATTSS